MGPTPSSCRTAPATLGLFKKVDRNAAYVSYGVYTSVSDGVTIPAPSPNLLPGMVC